MRRIHNYFLGAYLPIIFVIAILILSGNLTFGHGLGDIIYLGLIILSGIALGIFYAYQKGKKIENTWLLEIVGLIVLILIVLKATIFKGPE